MVTMLFIIIFWLIIALIGLYFLSNILLLFTTLLEWFVKILEFIIDSILQILSYFHKDQKNNNNHN